MFFSVATADIRGSTVKEANSRSQVCKFPFYFLYSLNYAGGVNFEKRFTVGNDKVELVVLCVFLFPTLMYMGPDNLSVHPAV